MKYFTIFISNGQIIRSGICSDEDYLFQKQQDTEQIIEVQTDPYTNYILNNEVMLLPTAPNSYSVFNYAKKQWYDPRTQETEWPLVRGKRNQLLAASDWTDTLSAPGRLGAEAYDAWQDYRQALRDVTGQADPFALVWPVAPGPT